MRVNRRELQAVEIQMGPMIDMVFLLLVFFMVTSKPTPQESDINIGLPGTAEQDTVLDIPDEQKIHILESGQVVLNDLPVDSPESQDLPSLVGTLKRFKQLADANKTEALITVAPHDESEHQRIVAVLNACAKAEITGVTFAEETNNHL